MWQAAGCGCQLVSTLLLPERRPGHLWPLPWPFPGLAWRPHPPLGPPGLTPGCRSLPPRRVSSRSLSWAAWPRGRWGSAEGRAAGTPASGSLKPEPRRPLGTGLRDAQRPFERLLLPSMGEDRVTRLPAVHWAHGGLVSGSLVCRRERREEGSGGPEPGGCDLWMGTSLTLTPKGA